MNAEITLLRQAAAKITPEQLEEFKAGRLTMAPALAALVMQIHGITEVAAPQQVIAVEPKQPAPPAADNSAWLASQDAYENARAQADAAGASPENLNALLQPTALTLPCGLTMLPLTLSGYIFLEAVQSPFVNGGEAPTPTDILFLAMALVIPEQAAMTIVFGDDFQPTLARTANLSDILLNFGQRVGSADVPMLMAHATRQFHLMFPTRQGGGESDPLKETPAAQAAGV